MTPAINEYEQTNGYFDQTWYYNGEKISTTSLSISILDSSRVRPASIGGGKVAGMWPLKAWFHEWSRFIPDYKSWSAIPEAEPLSRYEYNNAPYFSAGLLRDGSYQAAPFLNSGLFPVSLESQCRTEFLEKLQGSKWELGEALAEVKETAGFLRDGANSLADLLRRAGAKTARGAKGAAQLFSDENFVRFSNYVAGATPGRAAARRAEQARKKLADRYGMRPVTDAVNMWLGYQFGVKPLLHDLADATVNLNRTLFETAEGQGMRARLSVTKGETTRERSSHQIGATVTAGAGYIDWDVRSVVTIVGDYRTDDRMLRANQQLGLSSQVGLAYAVMPYSWLIDYFFQFGPWLNGLDAGLGLTPLGASVSRTQWVKPMKFTPYNTAYTYPGIKPWVANGSVESDPMAMRMVRSIEPMVYPSFPPLGEMLNVSQAMNSLAALTKLLR